MLAPRNEKMAEHVASKCDGLKYLASQSTKKYITVRRINDFPYSSRVQLHVLLYPLSYTVLNFLYLRWRP